MNSSAAALAAPDLVASRPKIHKLPNLGTSSPIPERGIEKSRLLFLVVAVSLVAAIALKIMQQVSVSNANNDNSTTTAQAAPAEATQAKTIALQGNSEAIVGELAKISPENQKNNNTAPSSAVDNNAGRELLSIISKY